MKIYIFALLTIGLVACKTAGTVSGGGDLKKRSTKFLLEQIDKNVIQYDWFVAKGKADFKNEKQDIGFSVDINIKKDSIIWLTAKKIGIEGMRVRITPEKIEVLNHLEKSYLSRPFSFLASDLKLNLSFADLQQLLVGNPLAMSEEKVEQKEEAGCYVLQQNSNETDIELHLNATNFLIEKLRGKALGSELEATISGYQEVNKQQVAFEKKLEVNKGLLKLGISFTKVEIGVPGKTNFNVPEHYTQDVK